MIKDVIELLRCPETGSAFELTATSQQDERVLEGTLTCVATGRQFKIEDGIANFLPQDPVEPDALAMPDVRAWEARRRELGSGFLERMFKPFEISSFRNAIDLSAEDWLLEVASGRGRLSVHFAGIPRRMVCVDPSLENLRVCQRAIADSGFRYTSFILADPLKLPFERDSFTKVVCSQLLQHVMDSEKRSMIVKELSRVCKTTGRICVSCYSYDLFAQLRKDKQGVHKSRLPYFRFTKEEFTKLLHEGMLVEEVTQKLQYMWVGSGVPMKEHSLILT
ncbi:MAG: class I SAM-dependent methyltransferase [Armatimonadetes bacterium]|nr:methyltransferase domain-containing protein [Armatimonadota bacterium]NOG93802.1 class I SAM-dependent methyltransferase [Armatimonadota bacterium]